MSIAKPKKTFHLKTVDGKYPVYPTHLCHHMDKKVVFCYIDDNFRFNTVDRAMVVNDMFDVLKEDDRLKKANRKLYIGHVAIKYESSRIGWTRQDVRTNIRITDDNVETILSTRCYGDICYDISNIIIPREYNIYSSYDSMDVYTGDHANFGMKMSALLTAFTIGDFVDSNSFDLQSLPLQIGDSCEVTYRKELRSCTITSIKTGGYGIIFDDGSSATVIPSRLKKLDTFDIDLKLENLPISVKENFETILKSDNLKVFDVSKNLISFQVRYREDMVEREVDTIVCSFCNVTTPLGSPCIGCKKTYREIIRKGNRVLLMVGPDPKPNTFCIEEAKCCDNCNFFAFGYGRNGKRATGYCDFTRQCVRSYNVCQKWFPVNEKEYSSHITGSTTNLGTGINRYNDEDITEFNYTKELHDKNKILGQLLKKNYSVSYNNLLKKLAEDYKL